VGAGRATAFLNVQPFVVLLLSWLVPDEPVHPYHVAGATLVIVGVWLTTRP
jgi:drug/metabolite transporter (DMT)-like permease